MGLKRRAVAVVSCKPYVWHEKIGVGWRYNFGLSIPLQTSCTSFTVGSTLAAVRQGATSLPVYTSFRVWTALTAVRHGASVNHIFGSASPQPTTGRAGNTWTCWIHSVVCCLHVHTAVNRSFYPTSSIISSLERHHTSCVFTHCCCGHPFYTLQVGKKKKKKSLS